MGVALEVAYHALRKADRPGPRLGTGIGMVDEDLKDSIKPVLKPVAPCLHECSARRKLRTESTYQLSDFALEFL